MTFTTRPLDDWCPTEGQCPSCGANVCTECGGLAAPVTCGDSFHCESCRDSCSRCLAAEREAS